MFMYRMKRMAMPRITSSEAIRSAPRMRSIPRFVSAFIAVPPGRMITRSATAPFHRIRQLLRIAAKTGGRRRQGVSGKQTLGLLPFELVRGVVEVLGHAPEDRLI